MAMINSPNQFNVVSSSELIISHFMHFHIKNNRYELAELSMKIFSKIIKYPNKQKYKDLNYQIIYNKFDKCYVCMEFFKIQGFSASKDKKRLIFNHNKLKMLKEKKESMSSTLSILMDPTKVLEIPLKHLSYLEYVIH